MDKIFKLLDGEKKEQNTFHDKNKEEIKKKTREQLGFEKEKEKVIMLNDHTLLSLTNITIKKRF